VQLVIDTGILISALIREGTPPQLLYDAWEKGEFTLLLSHESAEELQRVIQYPKMRPYFTIAQGERLLNYMLRYAVLVEDLPVIDLSPDPKDNHILATAIAGRADYIVSSDKRDLLALETVEGIPIITPRMALEVIRKR
jgi:uncharacterized protein